MTLRHVKRNARRRAEKANGLMSRVKLEFNRGETQKGPGQGLPPGEVELTKYDWYINRAVARRFILVGDATSTKWFHMRRLDMWRSGRGWRAKWPIGAAHGFVKCRLLNLIDGDQDD